MLRRRHFLPAANPAILSLHLQEHLTRLGGCSRPRSRLSLSQSHAKHCACTRQLMDPCRSCHAAAFHGHPPRPPPKGVEAAAGKPGAERQRRNRTGGKSYALPSPVRTGACTWATTNLHADMLTTCEMRASKHMLHDPARARGFMCMCLKSQTHKHMYA